MELPWRPEQRQGWFTFSWTPLHDESGCFQGFYCAATETTTRVLESQRLAEVMRVMDATEQVMQAGSWSVDLGSGTQTWSAGLLRLYGLDPADSAPSLQRCFELLHPDETELRQAGLGALLNRNGRLLEYRIVTPGGETRWLGTTIISEPDGLGQHDVIHGITVDLTPHKTLQQERLSLAQLISENQSLTKTLREQQQQLDLTLDAADLGLWRYEPGSGRLQIDHLISAMLGDPDDRPEPTVQSLQARMHPDDVEQTLKAHDDHLNGHADSYFAEYRLRHRQGHWVWVVATGKVVSRDANGQPLQLVGTLQDISQRKRQSEQGLDLLRQIKTLIQDMSHGSTEPQPRAEPSPLGQLTRRQQQILVLIAQGRTSAQIAAELNISPATAVSHRRDLMRKLQLHNTAEVTRFALRHGLVRGG